MTVTSHVLASGPDWGFTDVICASGPRDRPFEEQHAQVSISAVTQGTFQYRSRHGSAVLVPGSVLLGNPGACFECGHEHGHGDRCLAFHCTPAFLESIASGVAGARRTSFPVSSLPPLRQLMPVLAEAEAARDNRDAAAFEELAVRLAGAVIALLSHATLTPRPASPRDERRITDAVRRIEEHADEPLSLRDLARDADLSLFHFLRTFRQVAGMTPHQYVLRTRLHRAAVRLRQSDDAVAGIAYDAGFNDLSTFNRRFRRLMGANPTAYRASGCPA
ncbi:MAG: AraC family transcriptional regulator [Pseudolabrys sp.]|nr:AraC family transcriptional regulator [Pseudolabrys sp.]MDP2295727.1 AraC family transcriptional regulator [Pseudolabrys sp.]